MRDLVWGLIVVGSGVIFLCLLVCAAALLWPLPSSAMLERLLNAAGLFVTSIALILTACFLVLAVSAFGHITRIKQTSDKVFELAEITKKSARRTTKNEKATGCILKEIKADAINTIDIYTKIMSSTVWSSLSTIQELPSSPSFTDEQRRKVRNSLSKATEELTHTRATLILRMSYDPNDILSQLTVIAAMKKVKDIKLVTDVRAKWATNEQIRSLCIEVQQILRERGN